MSNYTELQEKAIVAAKEQLKAEPWFTGVCIDMLPSDKELQEDFAGGVEQLVIDTSYHDDPDFGILT